MTTLFLDLEGTVVDDISNMKLLSQNIRRISEFISKNHIEDIVIWSWAIFDDTPNRRDIELLVKQLFNISSVATITVNSAISGIFPEFRITNSLDILDIIGAHTKDSLLIMLMEKNHLRNVVLIDDTVVNKFVVINREQTLEVFNIMGI